MRIPFDAWMSGPEETVSHPADPWNDVALFAAISCCQIRATEWRGKRRIEVDDADRAGPTAFSTR
jgi:hypothetical protein